MWSAGAIAGTMVAFGVDNPGGQGEDFGKSSPVALVVLILFFVAVGFLVRSMTKHLRRLPTSFDEPGSAQGEERGGPAGDVRGADSSDPDAPSATAGEPSATSGHTGR
ncbi:MULTISPECIES: hypothetical protein [Actinoalloteichus]|uniref:Uncharacterized protein n=1 Tax=Actinoalloteichus caeruleus DSM 43889 TaxID=1120930 RepID=A0ABT1JIR2_ACTCY|nr:hypothetical protein [Actinoalloteichus caeruleus]MCP2332358.1 hypothetical protein [Actinoalloteichus caeruleus DSM 43889]